MKSKSAYRLVRTGSRNLAIAIVSLLAANAAHADSTTWTGTTDALWATLTNWSGSPVAVPGTGDTATFDSAGGAIDTISLGAGVTLNTLLFDTASAAAYTIGSGAVNSETLTLDNSGAVTVNSTVAYSQLLNAAFILGNDGTTQAFTLTNNSLVGGLTFAGTLTGSAGAGVKTIVVAGGGATSLSGIIANGASGGSVNLTKSGTGRLTLSANNSYTGLTTLNAGVLRATSNANALGTGAATLTLAGGNLQLANDSGLNFARNTTVSANTVITADRLTAGAGQTHTLGTLALGANTLSIAPGAFVSSGTAGMTFGATTLSGAPTLSLGYGTLLTLGAITDAGNTLTLQGGGNFAQGAAWASGTAGGLTLDTSYRGTATLNQANTFTGNITLKNGTLAANGNAGALGAGALDLQGGILDFNHSAGLNFGRNTTVNANATIISEKNAAGAGVTYTLGTLNMNGAYALTVRGGNVNSGTAGLTFGATTLNGNSVIDTWNPTVGSSASRCPATSC